jgi:hypothetical protein
MFTQPKNKLDLFEAMNEGKIIFVNTAQDVLKRDGSQLLGRFFIAMISQAALERSIIPEPARTPTFVYVDEAQEYFDDNVEVILNQARKYRVGLTLAHQTLDQLSPRLRSALLANTSMKCIGGVSARDARALADELRTTPEFIEGMKRRGARSEFAVRVKNLTGQAIRLSVPLGFLERQATLAEEDYDALLSGNRRRYCGTLAEIAALRPQVAATEVERSPAEPAAQPERNARATPDPVADGVPDDPAPIPAPTRVEPRLVFEPVVVPPPRDIPVPVARKPVPEVRAAGKGGPKHKYLQALIKELADQHGLKATIEAPLEGGAGQVDVLIERDGVLAAVEISVTTPVEQERENLRKCLDGPYPRIAVVLAKSKTAQNRYRTALLDGLTAIEQGRIAVLTPEELPDFVSSLTPPEASPETIVKGYRVRVVQAASSPDEQKARRERLAEVIARSLRDSKR